MSVAALGSCCPCDLIIKQASVATTWNAFSAFGVSDGTQQINFDETDPRYYSGKYVRTWFGPHIQSIMGTTGSVSQTTIVKWCGPLGNLGWTCDMSVEDRLKINTFWGLGHPFCHYLEINNTNTHYHTITHPDPNEADDPICAQYQSDGTEVSVDLSDFVDWRSPTGFSYETKLLDSVNWDRIPNGSTGSLDLTGFLTGRDSPELINDDPLDTFLTYFNGRPPTQADRDNAWIVTPILFLLGGQPASATSLCGPGSEYLSHLNFGDGSEPNGLDPLDGVRTNPLAIAVTDAGSEAPVLWRGGMIRTRIEIASACVLQFDQLNFDCDNLEFSDTANPCTPRVSGPIFYEPSSPAIRMIAITNANSFPCCGL